MSCNCPDINQCPDNSACLCGVNMDIYSPSGVLLETVIAHPWLVESGLTYTIYDSTAFETVLGQTYQLTIAYNDSLGRWEMSYVNTDIDESVVIGVLYGSADTCPIANCWDMDCIAVALNILGTYDSFFIWQGDYNNNKKSYEFVSDWSGSDINYSLLWGLAPVSAGAPSGTNCWSLYDEDSGSYVGYLFGLNNCPYGVYLTGWNQASSRFSFTDLGVTGYDVNTSYLDCGCCDESVLIDLTYDDILYTDVVATVVRDEYGNAVGINGHQYYSFEILLVPDPYTFYLFYDGSAWVMSESVDGEGEVLVSLELNSDCPFGAYTTYRTVTYFSVRGADCFDCCDYVQPRNRNLLKKKKAIFVDEISSIRNKEIFGFKCGTTWDNLFRKHLIFDVLSCLPYGVICDEEEQCLINNLNENCNC